MKPVAWRDRRNESKEIKNCYNCRYCEMNKFYECFCHYGKKSLFTEHGIPVQPDHCCDKFDEA